MPNKLTKEFSASQGVDGTFAGGLESAITLFELAVRASGGKNTQRVALHPIARMEMRVAVAIKSVAIGWKGCFSLALRLRLAGCHARLALRVLLVLSKSLIFTGVFYFRVRFIARNLISCSPCSQGSGSQELVLVLITASRLKNPLVHGE